MENDEGRRRNRIAQSLMVQGPDDDFLPTKATPQIRSNDKELDDYLTIWQSIFRTEKFLRIAATCNCALRNSKP